MEDIIRKAIEELMESKDREARFNINEDTIDLKVDKVSLGSTLINYKITLLIGNSEYTLLIMPYNYNADFISKLVKYAIHNYFSNKEKMNEVTWKVNRGLVKC